MIAQPISPDDLRDPIARTIGTAIGSSRLERTAADAVLQLLTEHAHKASDHASSHDALRNRITTALTREHYRRADERIEASPEEHQAAFADVVMGEVQPVLDAKDAELARLTARLDIAQQTIARQDAQLDAMRPDLAQLRALHQQIGDL